MMKLFEKRAGKKTRGQTMVEFALILPVLLMTMYGVMEFGRLLFIFVTTTSAAREATRYASAVEEVGGTERYRDCSGIRAAARRLDVLNAIETITINYYTDYGGANEDLQGTCPEGGVGPSLYLGDQVVVEVKAGFDPIVPMVPIRFGDPAQGTENKVIAQSARTVIKDVPVGILIPPEIPPPSGEPPWISFRSYYSFESESCDADPDCAGRTVNIPIKITDDSGNENVNVTSPIIVNFSISGLSEARYGVDYTILGYDVNLNRGQVTIPIEDPSTGTSIPIYIINDLLFEYYERVIIYLSSPTEGNIVWPNVHVLYIIDDDRLPPVVNFVDTTMDVQEGISGYADIHVRLDKLSGRDTIVPYQIVDYFEGTNYDDFEDGRIPIEDPADPLLPQPAILGFDYLLPTSSVIIPTGSYEGIIRVPILDDSLLEGPETIKFILGQPTNGDLGEYITHTLTILDNDVTPIVCGQYTLGLLERSGDTVSTSVINNGTGPVYITGINITWSNNQNLNRIRLDGENLWLGSVRPFPGIEWPQHDLQRRVDALTSKLLEFRFSNSSNPGVTNVTVTLDVPCSPLVRP